MRVFKDSYNRLYRSCKYVIDKLILSGTPEVKVYIDQEDQFDITGYLCHYSWELKTSEENVPRGESNIAGQSMFMRRIVQWHEGVYGIRIIQPVIHKGIPR